MKPFTLSFLFLFFFTNAANAAPAVTWTCLGENTELENFYDFRIEQSLWDAETKTYMLQELILHGSKYYDHNGIGKSRINLLKGESCPNKPELVLPSLEIVEIDGPSAKSPSGAKVRLELGCGDGFSTLSISAFCRKNK